MKLAFRSAPAFAVVALALVGFLSSHALAQSETASRTYEKSHVVRTNIAGVTSFAEPPSDFDAVNAKDEDLAGYGLPPRPDPYAHPDAYAKWAKAMRTPTKRVTGPLRDMHISSANAILARRASAAPGTATNTVSSSNWSGVVNTVPNLTSWSPTASFSFVVSEFNVPVARQAFGSCDGGWDIEVSWNGIDGYSNGDVLQGGSYSAAYCNKGVKDTNYFAWVEWYPSYSILEEFPVNPGDDIFVETWDTGPTNGYVYVADETLGKHGVYHLRPNQEPYLVGSSAEYVVERPCCNGFYLYGLMNYVHDFWADSYAYTFAAAKLGRCTTEDAGSTAPSTYILKMVDDQGSQVISSPAPGGRYDITFSSEGCAYSGGCQP